MRMSDWSSDVCSSDLRTQRLLRPGGPDLPRADLGSGARPRDRWLRSARACRRRHRVGDRQARPTGDSGQIGRASCRERVCPYVEISVVAVALKKKKSVDMTHTITIQTNE